MASPTPDTMTSASPASGVEPDPLTDGGPRGAGATFALPACGPSVAVARRRVREHLRAQGCGEDTCETAALLVSELATNAVRHTVSPTIVCTVRRDGRRVHVAVEDAGSVGDGPHLRAPNADEVCGRGLLLVDELCEEWGVTPGHGGTGRVVRAVFLDV